MSEKFVEKLTEAVSRRGILKTMSAAAAALVLGLFDVAHAGGCPAGTVAVGCCCLCKLPSTCTYGNCACQWIWTCDTQIGEIPLCRRYTCKECFTNPTPCDDDPASCPNAKCSRATYQTIPCS
jgi:hypothetical protein